MVAGRAPCPEKGRQTVIAGVCDACTTPGIDVCVKLMDDAASVQSGPPKQIVVENTYITTPGGYGEAYVFKQQKVQALLKKAIADHVEGQQYDPVKGSKQAKQIAEDLLQWVQALGFDRHKLVIQVTIGQKCGQAQRSRSWCLWDVRTDGAASESYENESMFCICQVYGLYFL